MVAHIISLNGIDWMEHSHTLNLLLYTHMLSIYTEDREKRRGTTHTSLVNL